MADPGPRTDDIHERDAYAQDGLSQQGTDQVTITGGLGVPSQDVQLRICGPTADYPASIEFWSGNPEVAGSVKIGSLSIGSTAVGLSNKSSNYQAGKLYINQSSNFVGINKPDPQTALDVFGQCLTVGLGSGDHQAKIRWRGVCNGHPSPPSGCAEAYIYKTGSVLQFRVIYNDNGTYRSNGFSLA